MNRIKLSAAILAAALWGHSARAADWTPAADQENLKAIGVPSAPAPAKAAPRDGQNYSGAEELLIKEFGITAISIDIPESEVTRQDRVYDNAFCFEHALRLALNDILEDYDEPSSPLARTLAALGAQAKPSKTELRKARQKLMGLLNDPASYISILSPRGQNQPENGERVEKNWIFFLRLAGNPYWSVVERSGEKPAYTYGGAK